MVKMTMNELGAALSAEEERELEAAERKTPVFDADSPEMTAEMLAQFKRINREARNKQTGPYSRFSVKKGTATRK